ncbi:MAG: hypothetical protein K2Y39_13195 [Candidatus Obscuribacterales bacterium]|nr:hypothetical protein [Candidatus Obscuribacterales bacterium]
MGRDWIDDRAVMMARDLDRGKGETVAEKLREDASRMSPRDFMKLVNQTQRYEQSGVGDDLVVSPIPGYNGGGKDISVNMRQSDRFGHPVIVNEAVARIEPPQRPQPGQQPQEQQGLDAKSVLLGTAIGIGIMAITRDNRNHRHDGRRR